MRTSAGAVIAARPRAAQTHPPPATVTSRPPGTGRTARNGDQQAIFDYDCRTARLAPQALTYRALVECADCAVPATAAGEGLCPTCLG